MNAEALTMIHALRYQLDRPEITTMGWCPKGCGYSSRGSDICSACLMEALSAAVGPEKADNVYYAIQNASDARKRLEAVIAEAVA